MNIEAHMKEVGGRWLAALQWYQSQEALLAEVEALTNGFFTRHPHIARTPAAEAFIAGLALDRISNAAVSQTEAQPKNQKVA
jgi:hypothetical protein